MRDHLTIGEVAKLLDTSTYNLRYYQKQGIISPSAQSENGYRLFSLDDVISIKCIMLLRKSGISIKEIQKLLNNYNKENYIKALERSQRRIDSEIQKLSILKKDIEKTLYTARNQSNQFFIKNFHARRFTEVKKSKYEEYYSAKDLFDISEKEGINKSLIISSKLYYVLYDNEISFCVPAQDGIKSALIHYYKGKYLCYKFTIKNYDDNKAFEEKVNEFINHISKNKYKPLSEILFIVNLGTSLVTENGFCGELQINIK